MNEFAQILIYMYLLHTNLLHNFLSTETSYQFLQLLQNRNKQCPKKILKSSIYLRLGKVKNALQQLSRFVIALETIHKVLIQERFEERTFYKIVIRQNRIRQRRFKASLF